MTKRLQLGVVSGHFKPKFEKVPLQVSRAWPHTLLCFVLIKPTGYELSLLKIQHKHRSGVFGCEGQAIYSNKVIQVAPGVNTSVIDSDLHCTEGGEFGTALNSWIFIAA